MSDARRDHWTVVMLVYTMCIWGANVVMIKLMAAHFDTIHLTAIRTVAAFAFIAAIGQVIGFRPQRVPRKDLLMLAVAAFLMVYVHQILLTQGLAWSSATNGGLALSLNPLLSVLLGMLVFRERPGLLGLAGVALGASGAAVVILNRTGADLAFHGLGDAMLLCSMLVYVAGGGFIRRLSRGMGAMAIAWYLYLIGGTMLLAHAALLPEFWMAQAWDAPITPWLLIALSAFFSTALGGLAWSHGISRLGLGRSSVFFNLLPLSTLATAVVFLDEVVLPAHVAGFLLVLSGTWLANQRIHHEPAR